MNSPINTDIFSETGCVRRELLLRYRDGKLPASDKHEVEKHLVDCPLCDEALEGLMLVSGTTVLDEINAAVREQSAASTGWKPGHYLAAAASFTALIFLSWFAFHQLNDIPENKMAVNEAPVPAKEMTPAAAAAVIEKEEEAPVQQQQNEMNEAGFSNVKKNVSKVTVDSEVAEEVSLGATEAPVVADVANYNDVTLAEPVAESSKDELFSTTAGTSVDIDRTVTNSGSYTLKSSPMVTYIDNLKVIDYNLNIPEEPAKGKGVPSGTESKFENREKKSQDTKAAKSSGLIVYRKTNYINLLTDPVVLFNKKRYQSAIEGFNEILSIHPGDENAIFYKGLSFYHLEDYSNAAKFLKQLYANPTGTFYEEANFYLAKTYIDSGDTEKGAALLKEVVNRKGFYASKAAEELSKIGR